MQNINIPVGTDLNMIIEQHNNNDKLNGINSQELQFPEWIYDAMPDPFPKLFSESKDQSKKDTALLSILVILSALIRDYFVYYDDKKEGVQLYAYILGDPAQGKGSVAKYRELGSLFHKEMRERSDEAIVEYKQLLKEWEENGQQGEEPQMPKRKGLFISGNNSKASLIRDLSNNEGRGLIFETETDTLYAANKSDFGNFSDILRKGFHSENISVNRMGFEDGAVEIEEIALSVIMTSTLDQLFKLIPTYENGLFSRFIFYILPPQLEFRQVFAKAKTERMYALINRISHLFREIGIENLKNVDKEFTFNTAQQERFNQFFGFVNETIIQYKVHLKGSVNRLGLICTRFAMILTYLRNYILLTDPEQTSGKPSIEANIICNEIDFDIAMAVTQKIVLHVLHVDQLYCRKNPKQMDSLLIHSDKRHSNEKKNEAIKMRGSGMTYSTIAEKLLGDSTLKGTIQKWVSKGKLFPVSVSETETNQPQKKLIDVRQALESSTVSYFDKVSESEPSSEFDLLLLLTTDLFSSFVENVRMSHGQEQKKYKLSMPAYTPSGIFWQARKKEHLKKHSKFICVDIDAKDNKHIENFHDLKNELAKVVNIAFVGRSVSGNGYYGIIPIENPDYHDEYFDAIQEAFAKLGIIVDKSCRDVSRLRIVSYDENYYLADRAVIFDSRIESAVPVREIEFIDKKRVINVINAINKQQLDITSDYKDWFSLGCSFANTFGEDGRHFFHEISKHNEKYNIKEADKQFDACLKNPRQNGNTLGTFFYHARKSGVNEFH